MSTVVGYQGTTDVDLTYMACVKGSPEVLKDMFVDPPMDYDDAYLQMARRGARVLALGYKTLGHLSHQQVRFRYSFSLAFINPIVTVLRFVPRIGSSSISIKWH